MVSRWKDDVILWDNTIISEVPGDEGLDESGHVARLLPVDGRDGMPEHHRVHGALEPYVPPREEELVDEEALV